MRRSVKRRAPDPGAEEGRGRGAEAPSEIPQPGWRDVLWRVWEQIGKDNVSMIAAGVAFYSLLAIFPAITAFVSLYGIVADPSQVQQQIQMLERVMPADALALIGDQLRSVASARTSSLGLGALVATLIALWSAGAGVRALMTALNIAYQEDEKRGFIRFYLVAFAFTVGLMAAAILSLLAVVALPVALQFLPLGGLAQVLITGLTWLILALVMVHRPGRDLPLRAEPRARQDAMGQLGRGRGGRSVAAGVARVRAVRRQLRQLQRDLWDPERGRRAADVVLALGLRRPARGGAERRDGASDRPGHDHRPTPADGRARRVRRRRSRQGALRHPLRN